MEKDFLTSFPTFSHSIKISKLLDLFISTLKICSLFFNIDSNFILSPSFRHTYL